MKAMKVSREELLCSDPLRQGVTLAGSMLRLVQGVIWEWCLMIPRQSIGLTNKSVAMVEAGDAAWVAKRQASTEVDQDGARLH